ncbi:MAG TPA: hypothetical protein VG817_00505 [Gemmatimonadales bacterium]|nr:hypothetical protein [Gemmatimonadales bacterium]
MIRLRLLLFPLLLAAATPAFAQNATIVARTSDVSTIDSILTALYATISGPVGKPRQWDRFATLFHPEARLIPTRCPAAGPCSLRTMTPAQYRQNADSFLVNEGFTEIELVRHVERYGSIAHAFSSYASYRRGETAPFARGINSIQLFWDGMRWWVLQIYWDAERPNNPLPPEFAGQTQ